VQPFGGEGKSGTGPKAGGPLYLKRLQNEAPEAIAGHSVFERQTPTTLETLAVWARQKGLTQVADLAEQYAHQSPYKSTLVLPGPTGERNTLSFVPRGTLLCVAETVDVLLNQLAAAFATGNRVAVPEATGARLPKDLPPALYAQIEVVSALPGTAHLALVEASMLSRFLPSFAAREGALLMSVPCHLHQAIPLWRLVAERALCVNTTAAGGNASLMTLQS
jgi:RHH-type proline utilization regulon transcriptional repressor/proline dehydrogenase/delta 1-pyrroline-5-carboxylate dehydrogenase